MQNTTTELATSSIAFSTSAAVLIALISYLNQIMKLDMILIFLISVIYININFIFLIYIKSKHKHENKNKKLV